MYVKPQASCFYSSLLKFHLASEEPALADWFKASSNAAFCLHKDWKAYGNLMEILSGNLGHDR